MKSTFVAIVAFFVEDISTCHSKNSNKDINSKMLAEIHLAASVSGSSCCACWLSHTETTEQYRTIINVISDTSAFMTMTNQNVCIRPTEDAKVMSVLFQQIRRFQKQGFTLHTHISWVDKYISFVKHV